MTERGTLVIISGPSGVGKSTILGKVFSMLDRYYFSVSMTTRAPRPGEVDGVNYFFTDKEHFEKMIEEDGFLEYAQYVGKYYGTPKEPVVRNLENGVDVILDVEVVGHKNVTAKMPEAVSVFIAPPSMEELESRLRGRGSGETEDVIKGRLERAREELAQAGEYDFVVVNDDADRAARELVTIIKNQKSKNGSNENHDALSFNA